MHMSLLEALNFKLEQVLKHSPCYLFLHVGAVARWMIQSFWAEWLLAQLKPPTVKERGEKEKPEQLQKEVMFEGVANDIKKGKCNYKEIDIAFECSVDLVDHSTFKLTLCF